MKEAGKLRKRLDDLENLITQKVWKFTHLN
jgi:hypothetical protein